MAGMWSIWLAGAMSLFGIDTRDTKMLSQPAVSDKHVAFAYADDLWICGLDGKDVRRLTSDSGVEGNPVFSPDGKWIAFSGQYDGNTDVYLISIDGGEPKRLTWHPTPDVPRCFTPDGTKILFCSARNVFTRRFQQFFTVPVTGGFPEQLPIPNGYRASISPDGKFIAYTPLGERFEQWKNYRGGTHTRIWIYNTANHAVEQIPQPSGRCNDTDPNWINEKTLVFRSDRAGEFNLFTFDLGAKQPTQISKFTDFPVVSVNAGGGNIVFEQAAGLHLMPASTTGGDSVQSHRMKIGVAADLIEPRPRYVRGSRNIRQGGISPSGARAVFEYRGEIVTVPAEKGDPRNLTNSPGANDRSPAWSPDGKTIAYFSDSSKEYELCLAPQDGKGQVRRIKLSGSGFFQRPSWSPDSKKFAYLDNSMTLWWLDIASGKCTKVCSEPFFGQGNLGFNWSPDSKWLTYTLGSRSALQQVYVYSIGDAKSTRITDGMSDCTEPCFDLNGKYLYFFASTDSGPVRHGFAQSSLDMRSRRSIYVAVLNKDQASPFKKESDEEKGPAEANEGGGERRIPRGGATGSLTGGAERRLPGARQGQLPP